MEKTYSVGIKILSIVENIFLLVLFFISSIYFFSIDILLFYFSLAFTLLLLFLTFRLIILKLKRFKILILTSEYIVFYDYFLFKKKKLKITNIEKSNIYENSKLGSKTKLVIKSNNDTYLLNSFYFKKKDLFEIFKLLNDK